MSDKYAVIHAHRTQYPIRLMCRVLTVSPAGYYAAQRRPPSAHAVADAQLHAVVCTAFAACHARYGSPRLHAQLAKDGVHVSAKRVARHMRDGGLVARRPGRWVATTDSAHAEPIAPNLLARAFAVGGALNTTWVADVTFIPTAMGWLYLAVVLDLASRRVIGWATSAANDTTLALAALHRALAFRRPPTGCVHHSDRGSPYASAAYRDTLRAHGMLASMSRRGDCWDNAVAESFFATLEWELLLTERFATHAAATRALVLFIDGWYNTVRLHSRLDYQSPIEYEQDLHRTPRAA